ncbi:MAG: HAMP domain-containing protein [Treponema sp.]|nr:HAMP domain-containing protein [Treponema sp.]
MDKKTKTKKEKRKTDKKVLFSIGFKLVTIVTLIVLMSLGSITALVSWMVRQDLQISAEDHNFEANQRSASMAEETLAKMQSDAMVLRSLPAKETVDFFFEQNPRIAAMFFTSSSQSDELLINENFFITTEIDSSLVNDYMNNHRTTLRRAALGETIVLNATPHFLVHLLALFYPGSPGGEMLLFFPENLNTSFSAGINQSWMINSAGDILIHADSDLVHDGVNVAGSRFIRDIQETPYRSRQSLVETDFGFSNIGEINMSIFRLGWENIRQSSREFFENIKQAIWPIIDKGLDAFTNFFLIERRKPQAVEEETLDTILQFVAYNKLSTGGCIVITNIEYDKVFEGIAATTRRNIYLTGVVLFFSIMFIWFFAKSISIPLKVLADAARKIEGGDFDLKLTPKGRDEIGVLTASFQKMCSALHIFGRFTNREIAIKAMRGQIKPGGLPKHATIFFSDIREFTAKSDKFTKVFGVEAPDRIVHWLNVYFTQMVDCVEKTGGTIDKFIGDAVMAHWGTAYSSGCPAKDAFNCVYSALMMRKALYEMNKMRKKGDHADPSICIGCGINTGIVTAGQLGSDKRMEYTVIGDPVNLASRIEALTKPLGADILISESTWRLVKKNFITQEMPSVTVKGKLKPVRIFAVVNHIGSHSGPRTIDEVRKLLGLKAPDIEKVDVNEDEKKYNIGGEKNQG